MHQHLPFVGQLKKIVERLQQRWAYTALHTGFYDAFEAIYQPSDEGSKYDQDNCDNGVHNVFVLQHSHYYKRYKKQDADGIEIGYSPVGGEIE
jgi:hypothetical protein